MPQDIYFKGDAFRGVMFLRFASEWERDKAVKVVKDGWWKAGWNTVWAKPDEPLEVRTVTSFMLGLKRQLVLWGFGRKEVAQGTLEEHFAVDRVKGWVAGRRDFSM